MSNFSAELDPFKLFFFLISVLLKMSLPQRRHLFVILQELPLMLSSHWPFLLLHPHMLFVGVSQCQSLLPQLLFANRLLLFFFVCVCVCLCCFVSPCLFVDIHGVCLLRMFFRGLFCVCGMPPPPCPPVARIQATAACRSSDGAKGRWRRRTTRASLMKESTTMTPTHSPPTCKHNHTGGDIYLSFFQHHLRAALFRPH